MKINDINHRTEINILRNERNFIRLENLFLIQEFDEFFKRYKDEFIR